MKKMAMPATAGKATEEFVAALKDNIEIIRGLRGGRTSIPDTKTVPFLLPAIAFFGGSLNGFSLNGSSLNGAQGRDTSLKREDCVALNAYFNEWSKAVRALVQRLDG